MTTADARVAGLEAAALVVLDVDPTAHAAEVRAAVLATWSTDLAELTAEAVTALTITAATAGQPESMAHRIDETLGTYLAGIVGLGALASSAILANRFADVLTIATTYHAPPAARP